MADIIIGLWSLSGGGEGSGVGRAKEVSAATGFCSFERKGEATSEDKD